MGAYLRRHLTFANVVALTALFIALGGGAYAIKANSVGTKQLKNNAVITPKIKNDAVNGDKVKESTLGQVPEALRAETADSARTAQTANSAGSATTAGSAATADTAVTAGTADIASAVGPGAVRGGDLGPVTTASFTSVPFPNGTIGDAIVQCPAGTTLLSGGGQPSEDVMPITGNRKSDPNGWRFFALNNTGGPATVTVFAYCLGA